MLGVERFGMEEWGKWGVLKNGVWKSYIEILYFIS